MSQLAPTGTVLLSEYDDLKLVVTSKHTSTGNGTEYVGTGTLEERLGTLVLQYLGEGIKRALVLNGLA